MLKWYAAAAVVAMAAGFAAVAQLSPDRVVETRHEAVSYGMPDPGTVSLHIPWTEDGYCEGQFRVTATETATEVRVGTVISEEFPNGMCPGLGTGPDPIASVELKLSTPLGDRELVRARDGHVLPLHTF